MNHFNGLKGKVPCYLLIFFTVIFGDLLLLTATSPLDHQRALVTILCWLKLRASFIATQKINFTAQIYMKILA